MGKHENELSLYLKDGLENLGVKFASEVETNQIFINLENEIIEILKPMYGFEMWEKGEKEVC